MPILGHGRVSEGSRPAPCSPCWRSLRRSRRRPAAAQVSDYEMQYGKTVEVSLDDLLQMPEYYVGKAVRTRGPARHDAGGRGQSPTRCAARSASRLYIFPVPEARERVRAPGAHAGSGRRSRSPGVVNAARTPRPAGSRLHAGLGLPGPARREGGRGATRRRCTLEELVTKAGALRRQDRDGPGAVPRREPVRRPAVREPASARPTG